MPDRDPVAKEWQDPDFVIRGWSVVFHSKSDFGARTAKQMLLERKPGDIVSGGGHVGIVSDDPAGSVGRAFSAASGSDAPEALPAAVVLSAWSFRLPNANNFASAADYEEAAKNNVRKFTVRRFVGI